MRAFTEADAAKVEPQDGEAKRLKHFGYPEQQLVAHDASVKRVRMAEKGRSSTEGGGLFRCHPHGLQAANWALDIDRFCIHTLCQLTCLQIRLAQ